MANNNEIIADIVAEKRHMADKIERDPGGCPNRFQRELISGLRKEADRLEAAHKREMATAEKSSAVGNAAKLYEAVGYILKYADSAACRDHDEHTRHYIDQIRKWAQSALSASPRNCDVGTAQEQDERFHRFCVKHHTGSCAGCHNPVGDYTVANGVRECALVWAQMPYVEKEGETK